MREILISTTGIVNSLKLNTKENKKKRLVSPEFNVPASDLIRINRKYYYLNLYTINQWFFVFFGTLEMSLYLNLDHAGHILEEKRKQ